MSASDVRGEVVEEIRKSILGPRYGPQETLREGPTSAYHTGILFPQVSGHVAGQDGEPLRPPQHDPADSTVPSYDIGRGDVARTLKPSSMGLGCMVPSATNEIDVTLHYGTYARTKNGKTTYHRKQHTESYTLRLGQEPIPLESNPHHLLMHTVRDGADGKFLNVFLVNGVRAGARTMTRDCLFQPRITLELPDTNFLDAGSKVGAEQDKLRAMLFRDQRIFATGYGCSAMWDEAGSQPPGKIWTEFIPYKTVQTVRPRDLPIEGLSMETLACVLEHKEFKDLLEPIAVSYEAWIRGLESRLPLLHADHHKAAREQVFRCREALRRIRAGIKAVSTDGVAGEAFVFANKAMHMQHVWGTWARKNSKAGRVDGYEPSDYKARWRLFQLAFLLMNVTSIAEPDSDERDLADLLWFPTGGGKTEAYLGLVAFVLAHRRLRNAPEYTRYGTAVIMRYTLRLLTIQQFQRAATLMCACEVLRRDDKKWGDEPFYVGLWVGQGTTPNNLDDARSSIMQEIQDGVPADPSPIQIRACPWCGQSLGARDYHIGGSPRQCRVYCPRRHCPFSDGRGVESGLPVLTVDEDIYRRCPALVIGTVDKFAQIAWNHKVAGMFGRVDKFCEKHGFVASKVDDCGNHRDAGHAYFENRGYATLEPPELIIQDELHLISGPLGTLVGIYETAIDMLCTRGNVRPKVVASTATTNNSQAQIRSIFDREYRVFPPPGFDFGDSFFSESCRTQNDRMYVGVCSTTGRDILGHLSAAVLGRVRMLRQSKLFRTEDMDYFYTLVSYFNTLRNLGGAENMYDDTVPRLLTRLSPDDFGKIQLSREDLAASRVDSGRIPDILKRLDMGMDSGKACDVLLCTNMFSVGVDVRRLGAIIMDGQPKNHAEYIQATGRIGRESPGLVVVNYNRFKPRDLSQYENFAHYHSALHRSVEATTLTPFSARARDRALFGVMVGLARMLDPGLARNGDARRFNGNAECIAAIQEYMLGRVARVDPGEADEMLEHCKSLTAKWTYCASKYGSLVYAKPVHVDGHALLGTTEEPDRGEIPVPMSLRDAEASVLARYASDGECGL